MLFGPKSLVPTKYANLEKKITAFRSPSVRPSIVPL